MCYSFDMPGDDLRRKTAEAAAEPDRLAAMRAAFRSVIRKQEENAHRFPDLARRRERLRQVRERCVGDPGILDRAVANLQANRVRVEKAADAAEAVRLVAAEVAGEVLLVKSKTNLSKEIGLAKALGEAGVRVVETDIGDRILQLSGGKTAHPTCPCASLDRYDIARALSGHLGREVEPDPVALIDEIRAELVPLVERARVGLTGANAIAAAEGAVLLVHNEGNLDLVSQRPGKLIILASPDKVYPDLEEAVNMVKLETYYATGQPVTAFMRVVSGPSRTADIEKEIFYGVHGPAEVVLVLVDNGRSELMADGRLREALFCVGCGSCLLQCPIYDVLGPDYGTPGHLGGVGVCAGWALGAGGLGSDAGSDRGLETAVEAGLTLCTTCALCTERCPVSLDVPGLVQELRARATAAAVLPIEEHRPLVSGIRDYANPWMQPRHARGRWAKGLSTAAPGTADTLFFAGCSYALLRPAVARAAVEALRTAGIEPLVLGGEERCCGSPLLRLGEVDLYERFARENVELIAGTGVSRVVAACPGCLKSLRDYTGMFESCGFEVLHVTQVLARALDEGKLGVRVSAARAGAVAAWHDPCHLGRGCGIYDEPRRLLAAAGGLDLRELEQNREHSGCCGSGGGVKTAFPDLAVAVGSKRAGMALAAGAGMLVTSCPWCEQNLGEHLETRDLLEVLEFTSP